MARAMEAAKPMCRCRQIRRHHATGCEMWKPFFSADDFAARSVHSESLVNSPFWRGQGPKQGYTKGCTCSVRFPTLTAAVNSARIIAQPRSESSKICASPRLFGLVLVGHNDRSFARCWLQKKIIPATKH
jgi:hypothetical protein